jgi:hypothetical protein
LALLEKKTYGYRERDEAKRQAFVAQLSTLPPSKIVYLDESGMDNRDEYGYPSSVTLRNTKQQESQTIHQEKKVEIDSWHELNRENRAINYD